VPERLVRVEVLHPDRPAATERVDGVVLRQPRSLMAASDACLPYGGGAARPIQGRRRRRVNRGATDHPTTGVVDTGRGGDSLPVIHPARPWRGKPVEVRR